MQKTIFASKPVDFSRIQFVGFSIDHVLVSYKSSYLSLIYDLTIQRLISDFSYPGDVLKSLSYTPHFTSAAHVADKQLGTALQIDEFCNITACLRGRTKLSKSQYTKLYPDRSIKLSDRFYTQDFTFGNILILLFIDLFQVFNDKFQTISDPLFKSSQSDIQLDQGFMPNVLWTDVESAFNKVVGQRTEILQKIKQSPQDYLVKPKKINQAIDRLKTSKKLFILSQNTYEYSDFVLSFIFNDYKQIFDYIIVDQNIQNFYTQKQLFRRMDPHKLLGGVGDKLEKHKIYTGGNISLFEQYTSFRANLTMYCCDQLIQSDDFYKQGKWRHCAILPSLYNEIETMARNKVLITKITQLELKQRELQSIHQLEHESKSSELRKVQQVLDILQQEYMDKFGVFGSKYHTSWALTKLGNHISVRTDLYTCSAANFFYYSTFNYFQCNFQNRFLPHQAIDIYNEEFCGQIAEEQLTQGISQNNSSADLTEQQISVE